MPLLAIIVGVVAAFGTGGTDEPAEQVVLGEEDLMEQVEIWRNQYRRMTPGDGPLVQDVGELPAAWEEFGNRWSSAPAERDLATWLVPFSAERQGDTTVIRDADGAVLWSGITDFAKPGSANVTITGALVDEADWPFYDASRWEVFRRLSASPPRLRDGEGGTNGNSTSNPSNMFVSAYSVFTNGFPELHVGLQWINDVTLDIFAFGALHEAETNEVTYTNDENQVITTNVTHWHSVEPGLTGRYDNLWEHAGTVSLTNGDEVVFIDTNYVQERWKVRFYTAFEPGDADNDGLNDAFEKAILGTSTNSTDSDNDGLSEWDEYYLHRTNPNATDSDHDWIDDPTELSLGLNPTNHDTDGDGSWDGVDPSPCISNVWWVMSTTTNPWTTYGFHYLGDETSWPTTPVWQTNLMVIGSRPHPDAIPGRVTLWGLVDDAIMVDSNQIEGAWSIGAKVLSNLDVTASITNLESARFRVDLFDWPDLPNGGPNETRLGSEDHPFRAEWEWWVPIEMYMEPVLTSATLPLDNPSGIIHESNAWFHVVTAPFGVVPETNILWTVRNENIVLTPTNRGTRVSVSATSVGEDELSVTVDGALGTIALPPFYVEVKPLTVVTAQVGIVKTPAGAGVVQPIHVYNVVNEANGVLAQAGIQLELSSSLTLIEHQNNYYNLNLSSTQAVNALMGELPSGNGIEIYFVNTIQRSEGGYDSGFNTDDGLALSATANGRTLAHEVGHACGLPDIYVSSTNEELSVTGSVEQSRMPQDWGNYQPEAGNPLEMSNAVKRLVMYGVGSPTTTKGDIPSGTIYGAGFEKYWVNGVQIKHWIMDDWAVGLSGIVHQPHHQ